MGIITKKKALTGIVISNKMHKTVTVSVMRKVKHNLYGKFMKKFTRCHVHDDSNICKIGDKVIITESRPYSKTKKWILLNVIKTTL